MSQLIPFHPESQRGRLSQLISSIRPTGGCYAKFIVPSPAAAGEGQGGGKLQAVRTQLLQATFTGWQRNRSEPRRRSLSVA